MKRQVLLVSLLLLSCCVFAQPQWKWARRDASAFSINPTAAGSALACANGNILWGDLQTKKTVYGSHALGDNLLHELDSSGNITATVTATGKLAIIQAQADAAGNWYVLGTFLDTVALGPTISLTRNSSGTTNSYFLFRLHAHTLSPDWLQLIGSPAGSNNTLSSFTIANNRLYAAVDSLVETHFYSFDPATGTPTRLWTQGGRSSSAQIQADNAGNIYLVGSCVLNGPLNFNGTTPPAPTGGQYPWYIVRYHSNGQYHWHYYLTDITCNARGFGLNGNNEVYLSGTLEDSTSLGSYHFNKPPSLFNTDYLLARLDSNGNIKWAQQRPVSTSAQGLVFFNTQFSTAVVDSSLFLLCETSGFSDWGNGVGTVTNNRHRATLVCYNSGTGSTQWAKTIDGLYTGGQQIIADSFSIWISGVGADSTAMALDTISVAMPGPGIYAPYVARMQVGTRKAGGPPSTATGNVTFSESIQVWPNPATDFVSVNGLYGDETISLRDLNGRTLQKSNAAPGRLRISTSGLPRGVYLIDIRSAQRASVSRLLLQ